MGDPEGLSSAQRMIEERYAERAVTSMGERYREMAEEVAQATWVLDLDADRFLFVSRAIERLRGFTPEEVMALPSSAALTPDSAAFLERVSPGRIAAFRAGERNVYVDELALRCKDGSVVWSECRSVMREDPETGHLLVVGSSHALGQKEHAFHDAMFEELQALGKIGAWSFDPVTGVGRWTDAVSLIHDTPPGYQPTAEEGIAFFAPGDRERVARCVRDAIELGKPYDIVVELVSATGARKWVRTIARPLVEHGQVVRVRGTMQDVTDVKRYEIELAEGRAQLLSLLDNQPDVVVFKDREGRFLAVNARVEQMFGTTRDHIIGKTDYDFQPKELADFFRAHDRRAMESPTPLSNEETVTFHDGHVELLEMVKAAVRGPSGEVIGVLGIGRDVTAARHAAKALHETEQQLRAAQKMEAVGRLAGGVAHDFNNLLSVILSYANLVSESLPSEDPLREDLAEILAAGKRGESLTRQLLAFSRRQILQFEPVMLDDTVETIGNMLRRLIGEDIELRIRRTRGLAATKADRGQIEQVLMNLVVNARDAMPRGGKITISTANVVVDDARASTLEVPAGAYVQLTVQDTGVGMDAATMARVFEPFFTTKRVGEGTGLGLAMAYGIVKQCGGAIAVESALGEGTTFGIFLPAFPELSPGGESADAAVRKARGTETVLVVEDEAKLRTVVGRILRAAGYDVLVAAHPDEALRIARETGDRLDLVFTDVVMPGMSGGELVERLGQICPRAKTIFTSGYTDETLARSGVGDRFFVAKPYQPAQLTAMIRDVLDGRA